MGAGRRSLTVCLEDRVSRSGGHRCKWENSGGPHYFLQVSEVISSNVGDRPCDKGAPEALKRGPL